MKGRHGTGERTDGKDLVAETKKLGCTVVYTREELAALPKDTKRVLGVFAHHHTFHYQKEERLREQGLPLYEPDAPTVGRGGRHR